MRILVLTLLAGHVPLAAQSWQLPPRGVAVYERTLRAPRTARPGFPAVAMPAVLLQGELDSRQESIELPPADLRDLPMWLAFDLRLADARRFTRRIDTVLELGGIEITGTTSKVDETGRQTITATLQRFEVERGSMPLAVYQARYGSGFALTGTLEIERVIDRDRGLVLSFEGKLRGELAPVEGPPGARPPRGGRPAGDEQRAVRVTDAWRFDRSERNRSPEFKERVAEAIRLGAEWVKDAIPRGGDEGGRGRDYSAGRLALCLLTLLKADVDAKDPAVEDGFARLRRSRIDDTYSLAVALMAMEALYAPKDERQMLLEGRIDAPKKRELPEADLALTTEWTAQLRRNFDVSQRPEYRLRFHYVEGSDRYDNSNTQYAILGLYSAYLCGVDLPATVWMANAKHWLADQESDEKRSLRLHTTGHREYDAVLEAERLRALGGEAPAVPLRTVTAPRTVEAAGWPYINLVTPRAAQATRERSGPLTGSMTTAGVTGATICEAVLRSERKGGDLIGKLAASREAGLAWLLDRFSVRTNRNMEHGNYHYYMYGLERACELNRIALLGERDWYFEGATILIATQDRGDGRSRGSFRHADLAQNCFAILFLKQSAPPLPVFTGR